MTCRKHHKSTGLVLFPCLLLGLTVVVAIGCTESDLYQWKTTPYQANKLTVSGTVCSDDLHQTDFPVKVLFVVDMSQPLARLVFYLLEPRSDDGLVTWNLLEGALGEGSYPILRRMGPGGGP